MLGSCQIRYLIVEAHGEQELMKVKHILRKCKISIKFREAYFIMYELNLNIIRKIDADTRDLSTRTFKHRQDNGN